MKCKPCSLVLFLTLVTLSFMVALVLSIVIFTRLSDQNVYIQDLINNVSLDPIYDIEEYQYYYTENSKFGEEKVAIAGRIYSMRKAGKNLVFIDLISDAKKI